MVDVINKTVKSNLKIACILDEFSYECFKYEVNLIPLDINNWKETLSKEKPDLLFVESAWLGNQGKWTYKVVDLTTSKDTTLKELVNECRKQNIPTVFWNKEDPLFFQFFIEAAKLFDYVFTTDEDCVEKYKNVLGHKNVFVLPFAAQPKLHNPIDRNKIRLGKVAFAGTWYRLYPNREKEMEMILKPALKYGVHIYDRMHHNYREKRLYEFPNIYRPYIRGGLPYEKIIHTYKRYDVFLNANLISNSNTMFSRRVFELLACGTNVISSYALGIDRLFPGIVKLCTSQEDVVKDLDLLLNHKQLRDRLSLVGQRKVFRQHTYRHRIETILEKIAIKDRKKDIPGVTVIACIKTHESMKNILDNFNRQIYKKKALIIVINDHSMDIEKCKNEIKDNNNIKILQIKGAISLGECLNFAIEQANYSYISKFSEDSYYAPEYIGDLMDAFKYTDADIVGKSTYYAYIKEIATLVIMSPSMENRYANYLYESSFIAKKGIYKQIKFPKTDIQTVTTFLKSCIHKGIKLYSIDRFNYVDIQHSLTNKDVLRKYEIVGNIDDYLTYITV